MVISSPSLITFDATFVPTIAGVLSSRLTIAAWQVRPPKSVTMPAAFFIIGTQSGSVILVTRISPSFTFAISLIDVTMRAFPVAICNPTLNPVAIISFLDV